MLDNKSIVSIGAMSIGIVMSSSIAFANEGDATVTANALNVRSEASIESMVIGKINKGQVVSVLESKDGWCKIKLSNGKTGWSSSKYLDFKEIEITNPTVTSPNNSQIKEGIVTASTLNVRSGASTTNSVITKVKKDTKVKILESTNGWYKVKLSDGQVGYCSSDYIKTQNNEETDKEENQELEQTIPTVNAPASTTLNLKAKIVTNILNVRKGPSTTNSVLTKVKNNDTVLVLEDINNGWLKIKLDNGQIGYCSDKYVSFNIDESNDNQTNDNEVENDENINNNQTNGNESNNSQNEEQTNNSKVDVVMSFAKKQIGKPYLWGAEGPNSFDCSGFVHYVFKEAGNVKLPRTSRDQFKAGTPVSKENLQAGDLVFSSSRSDKVITHVGIYIGDNKMIHSPQSGDTVKISDMSNTYWGKKYVGARRVL